MPSHYLLKSEPLPRLEDGVDVSFPFSRLLTSPDQSTTWDGVRNPRAGKTLREMKVGDEAFWYHSNTKTPEIVGVVKVTVDGKEQADTTAFDQSSPYYDPKSSREKPRWFMPTVQHSYPLSHSIPLALLQHISSPSLSSTQQQDIAYLCSTHLEAIGQMDLLRLGRLSVQTVSEKAWEALCLMGEKGGWDRWEGKWNAGTLGGKKQRMGMAKDEAAGSLMPAENAGGTTQGTVSKGKRKSVERRGEEEVEQTSKAAATQKAKMGRRSQTLGATDKSAGEAEAPRGDNAGLGRRRSSRLKR